MTSSREDDQFIASVISSTLLEESIEWIRSNMSPEDVFSESDLEQWAADEGYVQDK